MDIGALHFIRPLWLLSLPLAVLLPWAWRRWRRPAGDWASVCDPHLLSWLAGPQQGGAAGPGRQVAGLRRAGPWLAGLALLLGGLALAGPSLEQVPDSAFSARTARVLVVDLSQSMLATDLKPDRLTRARFLLSDWLRTEIEGQIALVAYAGEAFVVAPLTSDTKTILNLLPALRPDVLPAAGSRADRGLELAAELLQRAGIQGGEILLVSDAAHPRDAVLAESLKERGITTSVLGVGTRQGAPITSGSGFVSDSQGNVVIAHLEADSLRSVAAAGGGGFGVLDAAGNSDLPWQTGSASGFDRREDALGERWQDLGPWLVLLLLPLVAAAFRRGLLFCLPVCLPVCLPFSLASGLLLSPAAEAGVWDDLWQRRDQQAQQALGEGAPETAAALAKDPALAGEAWFRSGEPQLAAEAWSGASGADAHYNRGNALVHAGNLEGALAEYGQALELAPDMEDASHNLALVERMLEEQRRQQEAEQQKAEEEQQGESSESEEQSDEQGQQSDQPANEGEQQSEQNAEQGEQQQDQEAMAQAWSEEDAQAMEQWLRRIPDDPGGLLRRKFRSEYERRGARADEEQQW